MATYSAVKTKSTLQLSFGPLKRSVVQKRKQYFKYKKVLKRLNGAFLTLRHGNLQKWYQIWWSSDIKSSLKTSGRE